MNPKKIPTLCFVKRHLGTLGGLEKYSRFLANAFADRGCQVTLLCEEGEDKLNDNIEIVKLPKHFSLNATQSFDHSASKWLKKNQHDIVFGMCRSSQNTHIRAGNGVHRAYLERRKQIDPWIKRNTWFFNPNHKAILNIEKRSFESPQLVTLFTNSNMVKNEVLRHYTISEDKIEVVHNGVEHTAWQESFDSWPSTKEQMLKELDLNPDEHQFLFIGNGYHRKGLLPLMKSLAKLNGYHLHVVGKEKNITSFRKEAKLLGLSSHVTFHGPQPDITKFYALADTLVIPSYYDPFANVTVEALAMGVYVISSLSNGGSEILTPQNGAIIPSLFDINSFCDILSKRVAMRKTTDEAIMLRSSVAHLDFEIQLTKIVDRCLTNSLS